MNKESAVVVVVLGLLCCLFLALLFRAGVCFSPRTGRAASPSEPGKLFFVGIALGLLGALLIVVGSFSLSLEQLIRLVLRIVGCTAVALSASVLRRDPPKVFRYAVGLILCGGGFFIWSFFI